MNLYILVEGEKTELALYPKWIEHFIPELKQKFHLKEITDNCFYILSGGGIPSINNHSVNAIKDINNNPIFDYLIIAVDGEEIGIERRKQKILKHIEDAQIVLHERCIIKIIVQNACIETWFLGNRKFFKRNPQSDILRRYISHYSVYENDPEGMSRLDSFPNKATFHISYLKEMFKEHKLSYTKSNPREVTEVRYLEQLKKRALETEHLTSLRELFQLFFEIKQKIN